MDGDRMDMGGGMGGFGMRNMGANNMMRNMQARA